METICIHHSSDAGSAVSAQTHVPCSIAIWLAHAMDHDAANEVCMGGKGVYLGHGNGEGIDHTGLLPSGDAVNGILHGLFPINFVDGRGNDVDGFGKGGCPGNVVNPGIGKGVYPGQGVDGVGKGGCTSKGDLGQGVYGIGKGGCTGMGAYHGLGTGVDGVGNGDDGHGIGVDGIGWGAHGVADPDDGWNRGNKEGIAEMERVVLDACDGLYKFFGLVARCHAEQPAYADLLVQKPRGTWAGCKTFPIFEVMMDGNRWAPYCKDKQEQLRQVLQECVTVRSTELQYGPMYKPCWFYYVMLIKCADGSVVGTQVNAHSGKNRKIRVWFGPEGARSQHTRMQG